MTATPHGEGGDAALLALWARYRDAATRAMEVSRQIAAAEEALPLWALFPSSTLLDDAEQAEIDMPGWSGRLVSAVAITTRNEEDMAEARARGEAWALDLAEERCRRRRAFWDARMAEVEQLQEAAGLSPLRLRLGAIGEEQDAIAACIERTPAAGFPGLLVKLRLLEWLAESYGIENDGGGLLSGAIAGLQLITGVEVPGMPPSASGGAGLSPIPLGGAATQDAADAR